MKPFLAPAVAVAVVACAGWVAAHAQDDAGKPTPADLAQQATERAKAFRIDTPLPQISDEQRQKAQALAEGARNRAKAELSRLADQHPYTPSPGLPTAAASDNPDEKAPSDAPLAGRVVIALSSSMPENELREYLAQLDGKREALVVLRGFMGGARTVMPTGQFLEPLMRKPGTTGVVGPHRRVNIVVDPLLYRSLGIDKVPAVAWLPGVTEVSHCEDKVFESAVTVYGTTSVAYALKQINANGGAVPAEVLKKFGG